MEDVKLSKRMKLITNKLIDRHQSDYANVILKSRIA